METITEIESAVTKLSENELAEFRNWFAEYDAAHWDVRFEQDVQSGKLDLLGNKAVADFKAGRIREL